MRAARACHRMGATRKSLQLRNGRVLEGPAATDMARGAIRVRVFCLVLPQRTARLEKFKGNGLLLLVMR